MKKLSLFILLAICALCWAEGQSLPGVSPKKAGIDANHLLYADRAINQSIADKEIPGAVLAVVRHGKLAYLKAYGNKQVYPDTLPMTTNTVFDLASLSKPLSTAISTMILLDRGQLRLRDRVDEYIPGFKPWTDSISGDTQSIRIIHLMTHTSGLQPYAPVTELQERYTTPNPEGLMAYISSINRNHPPGTVFKYSCLNFITLQHIVENITGMSLQSFARDNIFKPLRMEHTGYNPTGETLALTAPTEKQPDGSVLKGKVHDPLARIMNNGVSGNAGLFSSVGDIAILAAMLLNNGEINKVRILSPLAVKAMQSVPYGYEQFGRSLGWDVCSAYATDGDLFDVKAFGHTGYTGTSITIDPGTKTAIILLTNRVHPDDAGAVIRLRDIVANVVAASIIKP